MTRKGFLALAILPFFGIRKKTPPPVAIALAKAGVAATEAMYRRMIFNGLTIEGTKLVGIVNKKPRK